jgi:ketosteroid isomerase-like protein
MSAAEIAANNRAFESAIATGNVDAIAALLAPDVIALPRPRRHGQPRIQCIQ